MTMEENSKNVSIFLSQRGLLCGMVFLANLFVMLLQNIMALGIVCLTSTLDGRFTWSPKLQGLVLSAGIFGYTIMMPLGGFIIMRIGSKNTISAGLIVASTMTLISPFATILSPYALMFTECLKGRSFTFYETNIEYAWRKYNIGIKVSIHPVAKQIVAWSACQFFGSISMLNIKGKLCRTSLFKSSGSQKAMLC